MPADYPLECVQEYCYVWHSFQRDGTLCMVCLALLLQ
jgi:hypothetical protein